MAPLDPKQQAQRVALLQWLTASLQSEARAAFVPQAYSTESALTEDPVG